MRLFVILFLVTMATGALSQLYPSKLNLAESVAIRLSEPRVQHELGLSDGQVDRINDLVATHTSRQAAINQRMTNAGAPDIAKLTQELDTLDGTTARQIVAALDLSQKERLWQLAIQDAGPFALRSSVVAKKVAVTSAQSKQIEAISAKTLAELNLLSEQVGKQIDSVPKGSAGNARRDSISKAFLAKSEQVEARGARSVLALLTKAQKVKWQAIQGRPFRL